MKKIMMICLLISTSAFSEDIVTIGNSGKSSMIYEKNGQIMFRICPSYTLVDKRKDCTSDTEYIAMKSEELRPFLTKFAKDRIKSGFIKDKVFNGGSLWTDVNKGNIHELLSYEDRVSTQGELKKLLDYKERFGEEKIDTNRLKQVQLLLDKDQKALLMQQEIEKELDSIIVKIKDGQSLHTEGLEASAFQDELLVQLGENLIGKTVPVNNCTYQSHGGYYHRKQILSASNEVITFSSDMGSNLCTIDSDYSRQSYYCDTVMKGLVEKGICKIGPKIEMVKVDPTADIAISQAQRSLIKEKPQTSPSSSSSKGSKQ